jgi:hypothetical protein
MTHDGPVESIVRDHRTEAAASTDGGPPGCARCSTASRVPARRRVVDDDHLPGSCWGADRRRQHFVAYLPGSHRRSHVVRGAPPPGRPLAGARRWRDRPRRGQASSSGRPGADRRARVRAPPDRTPCGPSRSRGRGLTTASAASGGTSPTDARYIAVRYPLRRAHRRRRAPPGGGRRTSGAARDVPVGHARRGDRLGDVGPSAPDTWPAPFAGRAARRRAFGGAPGACRLIPSGDDTRAGPAPGLPSRSGSATASATHHRGVGRKVHPQRVRGAAQVARWSGRRSSATPTGGEGRRAPTPPSSRSRQLPGRQAGRT